MIKYISGISKLHKKNKIEVEINISINN